MHRVVNILATLLDTKKGREHFGEPSRQEHGTENENGGLMVLAMDYIAVCTHVYVYVCIYIYV